MKKAWIWVIGILIGLVVLAALVGAGFLVFGGMHAVRVENGLGRGWPQQAPGMMPYNGFGEHLRGPDMMGRGGRMPLGGFIGGLICLGFLVLIGLGIFWLVRAARKPAGADSTAVPAAMPAPLLDTCKKCGKPIQADWKNCPYCGKKV